MVAESSQTARATGITFVQVNMEWGRLRWLGPLHDTGVNDLRCLPGWCFRSGYQWVRDMSDTEHHQVLHPTRIDIPQEIRLFLIRQLNQTLACTADLRSQVKQAAWNVKGKEYSQLQALFRVI